MNSAARAAASPQKGGAPDAGRPLDTGAVTKRLQQELMSLMASGGDGVSAFPAGDSLFDWVGTINVSGRCHHARRVQRCLCVFSPGFFPAVACSAQLCHVVRFC